MSLQAITSALALRGYAASEKLLLIAWANYADENFRCYPSQRRLAEDTGLSDRQIRTIASNLEDRGCIVRQERRRPDGSRSSDVVTLLCLQAEVTSGGVRKSLPGGAEVTSGHNLSINHSKVLKEPKRATKRVPSDWSPDPEDFQVGLDEGLEPGIVDRELRKFRDHTFNPPRSDWNATFRNWLRQAAERRPKDDRAKPSPKLDHLERVARAMAASVERPEHQCGGNPGQPGHGGGVPRLRAVT